MRTLLLVLGISCGLLSCQNKQEFEEDNLTTEFIKSQNSSPDEVKLLNAWSSNESSPVMQKFVRRFQVKVKNIDYRKEVFVHHQTLSGEWKDIALHYEKSIDDLYELWTATEITDSEIYSDHFAIKYVAKGKTFWDNNKGNNYELITNTGRTLVGDLPISLDRYYTKLVNNYLVINVDIKKQYQQPAIVEAVYTMDNWLTTQRIQLSSLRYFRVGYAEYIMSPNIYDAEKWETSIRFDVPIEKVEFAIAYQIGDVTYWDNNYGDNYVLIQNEEVLSLDL